MTTNAELMFNCLQIEALVKTMVLQGIVDDKKLVAAVDKQFPPTNEFEMEMYSEAIIYAKLSILN